MAKGMKPTWSHSMRHSPCLKLRVDTKRINFPSNSEGDDRQIVKPTTITISAPRTPSSSTNQIVALLELDFAEFKELTQVRLSGRPDSTVKQLKEELQQLKRDSEAFSEDW
ncbi:hypothetical protein VZT92_010372 [Zoarces viviparus]|uniref:Uncharacterized protein n=1 Tax=Zoarces viviparus TaxID=48416 RepID=A0AAW1FED9_ZOAVI